MTLRQHRVTFSADGVPDAVATMGEGAAQVQSGYGGWVVVSRLRRIGLTQWQGKDPLRMSIPILFAGMRDQQGQELQISHLSRMALPPLAGGEPPTVTVDGDAVPAPGPVVWVIENLQWGNNVVWENIGGIKARTKQDCIVNLLEYRGDDRVAFKAIMPGTTAGKSKSGWPKTYNVHDGDTLQKIAARFYKDASKWKQIATANGLRDPKNLKGKKTLRIPQP